jgi:hypothetical protein
VFVFVVVGKGRRKKESEFKRRLEPQTKQTVGTASRPRRGEARQAGGLHAHARGLCDHEGIEAGCVK